MLKISLNKVRFFAYHGLYPGEDIVGGQFEVDLHIRILERNLVNSLVDTINYETLFNIVRERMEITTPLLETIAMDVAATIKQKFPRVMEINITISKLNPPIPNFQGAVSVSYEKKYE
jgi:dihydroneopterin aldolase